MSRKIFLISVLLSVLVVSCRSNGGPKAPKPPSAGMKAVQLQVTRKSDVFVEETQLLSISPDGRWFLGLRLDAICIFDATTQNEKVCTSWKTTLDPNSIAWAPDSQRVAFTENLTTLSESDIWVLDIPSGALNNLTNDGLDGDLTTSLQRAKSEIKEINLDNLPVFSPDGKTIAFIRSTYGDTKQTHLCLIQSTGGQVTKLALVDDEHSLAVWRGMRWTPDGKKILFTIAILGDTSGRNGIWSIEKNGKNVKHIVKDKEGWGYAALYDISVKGDKALIGYPRALAQADKYGDLSFYELLDLKTGDLTPIKEVSTGNDQSGSQPEFYSPTRITFSPDGTKILYHYNTPGGKDLVPQLVVRDVNSTTEQVLESRAIYLGEDVGSTLFWAHNDTIYLMTGPGLGVLYTLGSK